MNKRMALKQIARQVRRQMEVKTTNRVYMVAKTITAASTTYTSLLKADSTPNSDLISDGTNIAECETGSRISYMQLHMSFYGLDAGSMLEWFVYKDPDAFLSTTATMSLLYTADYTPSVAVMRKNTLAVGHFISSAGKEVQNATIIVPRKTMRRVGLMAEDDVLKIGVTTDDDSNFQMYLRGRIVTRRA